MESRWWGVGVVLACVEAVELSAAGTPKTALPKASDVVAMLHQGVYLMVSPQTQKLGSPVVGFLGPRTGCLSISELKEGAHPGTRSLTQQRCFWIWMCLCIQNPFWRETAFGMPKVFGPLYEAYSPAPNGLNGGTAPSRAHVQQRERSRLGLGRSQVQVDEPLGDAS